MHRLFIGIIVGLLLFVFTSSSEARLNGKAPIKDSFGWVSHNPADNFLSQPIEDSVYDPATKCKNMSRPGIKLASKWLSKNTKGEFWGSYRCEMWGKKSASLHAENRAIDWHLNWTNQSEKKAGMKLIHTLLAPDKQGNQNALARRMGVEEIIWGCSYWGSWGNQFSKYSYCYNAKGKRKKNIDATAAHLDHLHIGFTKAGSNGKTSFWKWYRKHQ